MEENKNNQNSNFKTVQDKNTYDSYSSKEFSKTKISFSKGVLLPFLSGILGCSVVIGTCFGVPTIRNKLLNTNLSSNQSNSESNGYVSQTSLSTYSDTAVYAANKILPSIVGIKVEYNVNSLVSMFGRQSRKHYCYC